MSPALTALLSLADEKLRAAGLLVAGGAWGDASSRAYYAAFVRRQCDAPLTWIAEGFTVVAEITAGESIRQEQ